MIATCTPSSRQCVYFRHERLFLPLLFLSLLIPFLPVVCFYCIAGPDSLETTTMAAEPQPCTPARRKTGTKPQVPTKHPCFLPPFLPCCRVCSEPASNTFPTFTKLPVLPYFSPATTAVLAQMFPVALVLTHSQCASFRIGEYLCSNSWGCRGFSVSMTSSVPFSSDMELVGASHGTHGVLYP